MKPYGKITRIRLSLDNSECSYNCYVVFDNHMSASKAKEYYHEHSVNERTLRTRLFHINNFKDESHDFFPENSSNSENIERKLAAPRWFVASYKTDKDNVIKGAECIRRKVGNIPDDNLKRYGKSILIKAGNNSQSCLLCHFKAPEDSNIDKISPHKSFNYAKGLVYSKELYDFSDDEILKRCPDNVWHVQKLKGINHAILIMFVSSFLPEYIKISGINFTVKKFRPRPTQCHKCFEYGHVVKYCQNDARCYICSSVHDTRTEKCTKNKFCFQCKGPHSPNWRQCPIFRFNQDVIELAENEYISFGAARQRLRKNPNTPMQTFASTTKTSNQGTNKTTSPNLLSATAASSNSSKEDNNTTKHTANNNPLAGPSKEAPDSSSSDISKNAVRPKTITSKSNEGF